MHIHASSALPPAQVESDFIRALLETDRHYFVLAAKRSSASGLELLYMEGHVNSPSGAVIWGVDGRCGEDGFRDMLLRAESELQHLGGRVMRVYLEDPVPQTRVNAFSRLLYRPRTELALMARLPLPFGELDPTYRLRAVQNEQDWRMKEALHAGEEGQPDGYRLSASAWVELERKKCATGQMSCYLVFWADEPVATVALMRDGDVARLKNLYVGAQHRRRGVGLATILLLGQKANELGCRRFGCFAVEGGKALGVYERAGLRVVASVTEFSKELAPSRLRRRLSEKDHGTN